MFKALPAKIALPALVAGLAVWAPAAWAGGYLSGYGSSGSSRYLSDYSSGGYNPGSSSGYIYYGGDSGSSSYGSRSDPYAGDIPPKYWSVWNRSKSKRDSSVWDSMFNVSPAAGYANPCGTYNRAPARCFRGTTKYDPAIHGLGSVRN